MTIGSLSVRNPVLINILTVLILIVGTLSIIRLPQEQFSEVPFFFINIVVPYPGVSAEDIESTVTARVETAMQGLDQLSTTRSQTSDGVATISLEFDQGITRREFDRVFQETQNRYNALSLPEGASSAQITEFSSNDFLPVIEVVLYGDAPYEQLNQTARRLADRLEGVREVSGIGLVGSRDPLILVEPDQQRLETIGLGLEHVVQALQARNVTIPGGSLVTPSRSLLLRTVGEISSASDLENIILRSGDAGQVVRIGDVARISDAFDNQGLTARYNGQEAVTLRITKVPGGSSVGIIEDSERVVQQFIEQGFAEGIEITYFNDSTVQIRDSIDVLVTNAVYGLILLVAILLVFVGLRNALMAAIGIPVTFAATFILLEYLGETLNSNTLFGLVLVLGLIVDHAIVIVENSFRLQQQGLDRHQAAIQGVNQVAIPVWAATLTTVAAFLPLTFLPGIIGRFLRVVPLTVSIALIVSTIEATAFLPSHFADWPGKLRESRFARWFHGLQDGFARILRSIYQRRGRAVALVLMIMVTTFAMTGFIPQNLFDSEDFSVFFIDIQMPAGTPIDATDRTVGRFEQALLPLVGNGEVQAVNAYVGFSAGSNENVSDPTVGQIVVDLTERAEGRSRSVPEVLAEAEQLTLHIAGAEEVRYRTQQTGPPVDPPLSFRLFGNSFEQLSTAAAAIREELRSIDGVFDVRDNLELSSPELRIVVDDFQASRYGLTRSSVGRFIRSAFDGVDAGSVFVDNEEITIRVRYELPPAMTYDRFTQLRIPTPDGRSIPLEAVARIEDSEVLSSIRRLDGRREVTIEAEAADTIDLGSINRRIETLYNRDIAATVPDVQLSVGGQFAEFGTLLFDILRVFLIGIFLIYLILATQFHSYSQPILIMFSVPFAFVGVILFLLLTGTPLSTTVIYAGVALAGIAVNDSIVLISFINEEREQGMSVTEAVINGAATRLRPILLTSLTTIAGLLPIALGIGGRSAIWSPMAGTIVFGLVFSTITALVIIPCVYGLFYDRRRRDPRKKRGSVKKIASTFLLAAVLAVPPIGAQAPPTAPTVEQPAGAPQLTLTEVLQAVAEHSPDLQIAALAREEARLGYQAARAAVGPQLELDAELYSYDSRRIDPQGQPGSQSQSAQSSFESRSHSSEPRLRGSLPLPGDGRLNLETGAALRRTLTAPDEPFEQLSYSLTPYVSARLTQPVAVNGRLIETRSLAARDSLARSGYEAGRLAEREAGNQLFAAAVQLYLSVYDLRAAAAALEFARDLDRRRIEQAELDRADGLITDRQLLQLRTAANRTRETQLDVRENLRRTERRLTELTGGTLASVGYSLSIDFSAATALLRRQQDGDGSSPVAVERAERARQEAELQRIVAAVGRAPQLSLFARVEPRYPEQRDNPDELSGVFQGLGDGYDWTAGVSLRWPLYDGGAAAYAAEAEQTAVQQAGKRVEQSRRDAADELTETEQRVAILQERIELLVQDLELAERNLADLQTRAEFGQVGSLRIDEARLDVFQAGNSLSHARSELLNALVGRAIDAGFSLNELLLPVAARPARDEAKQ